MDGTGKHIDRIYQEAFQNFEVIPPHSAWQNIEANLTKRKRKKIIPLFVFLKYAAIVTAGLFIFGLGALYQNFKTASPSFDNQFISNKQYNSLNFERSFRISQFNHKINKENSSAIWQDLNKVFDKIPTHQKYHPDNQKDKPTTEHQKLNGISQQESASIINSSLEYETSILAFDKHHLHKKSQTTKPTKIENPWIINPQVAPIYAGSLNGSNTLNQKFSAHSADINMSYGVKLAYQITPKLSLRTGVNQVNMNYTTADIVQTLSKASYTKTNLKNNIVSQQKFITTLDAKRANKQFNNSDYINSGYLNQDMGFIEIPLEIEYHLIDKKIGLHIMAGTSTLLLNQNNVSYKTENSSSYVGKTANMNKTSFSANIGFGVDYNLNQRWSVNLEPNFKYQLNTFKSETTNVQPYYFGLFSGVKFRF